MHPLAQLRKKDQRGTRKNNSGFKSRLKEILRFEESHFRIEFAEDLLILRLNKICFAT
jgi:hypothetical protein